MMNASDSAGGCYETAHDLDLARDNVKEFARLGYFDPITCHEICQGLRAQYAVIERVFHGGSIRNAESVHGASLYAVSSPIDGSREPSAVDLPKTKNGSWEKSNEPSSNTGIERCKSALT